METFEHANEFCFSFVCTLSTTNKEKVSIMISLYIKKILQSASAALDIRVQRELAFVKETLKDGGSTPHRVAEGRRRHGRRHAR